ncbi:MAG: hypothetical protein ACK5MH_01465 [Bacteroidales bacterium]
MNIVDYFEAIIIDTQTYDEALSKFKDDISESKLLKLEYTQWCNELGLKLKHGFKEYYHQYYSNEEKNIYNIFENGEEFYEYISFNY